MKRDKWEARLAEIKRREKPEAVLMLAGSNELTRIAVAWLAMPVARRKRLSPCRRNDVDCVWRWLWENADYSRVDFFCRLTVSAEKAERMFDALVANRVRYPDGTVNSYVQRYLRQRVLTLFRIHRSTQSRDTAASGARQFQTNTYGLRGYHAYSEADGRDRS